MAQQCGQCGKDNYRTTFVASQGKWLGAECGCFSVRFLRDTDSPFSTNGELVLQHIHDSDGKPLRVTSMRELEAAQSKYHFNHVVTNMDRGNQDQPKQQRVYTIRDLVRSKFARGHA